MQQARKELTIFGRGRRDSDVFVTEAISFRARQLRKSLDLTQLEVSLELGISCRTVEKIEAGRVFIRADVAQKLQALYVRSIL